jgi:hypothetical protein
MSELRRICEDLLRDASALAVLLIAESVTLVELGAIRPNDAGRDHAEVIAPGVTLVVCFDERSSLGLVRLGMKKAGERLVRALAREPGSGTPTTASTN